MKRKHNAKVGDTYGEFTVISEEEKVQSGSRYWKVRCSCDREMYRGVKTLVKKDSGNQCIHCFNESRKGILKTNIPEVGKLFGHWKVISDEVYTNNLKNVNDRNTMWLVECQKCNSVSRRSSYSIKSGTSTQCRSCAKALERSGTFSTSYINKVRQRAKDSKLEFNITNEYIHRLLLQQNSKCVYSGIPISCFDSTNITASLDRIDSSKGYIEGNVQWLHKDVNLMKLTHSEEYFIHLCNLISTKYNL